MSVPIDGSVSSGFERVRDVFESNFETQGDVGASFCAYKDGEKVVDLWGGHSDKAKSKPWTEETLANVWSTTKGMTATVIARLVQQGKLDYSTPVAEYWPEFGAKGKDKITVAQMMSHQSGICGFKQAIEIEDYYVPHKLAAILAAMEPLWEPGTRTGYHAVTFGWLAGELAWRVSNKSLGTIFREEIAKPLDADVHIGLAEAEDHRAAEMIPAKVDPDAAAPRQNEFQKVAIGAGPESARAPNVRAWRAAEMPAINAQANAAGIARVYAALSQGGSLDGVEVLKPETLALATTEQFANDDLVLAFPMSWACGFIRNSSKIIYGPNKAAFGHSGWGGSFGSADPEAGVAMGYAMNQMQQNLAGDPRTLGLVDAVYRSL